MIPPKHLMYDGPTEHYASNGLEFLGHYKSLCNLKPNERMLDVGSGLGRKTVPLMDYLVEGSYEGFDCKEIGVRWCQENITPQASNFKFQFVDVYAPGYNPEGKILPLDFKFPFADAEFDFIVLGSVFTHMQYSIVYHYLGEIYRVLKQGGRCLITWFITSRDTKPPVFGYRHQYGWYSNPNLVEEAIAFDIDVVEDLYKLNKLSIKKLETGNWSGVKGLSHQDLILAVKEGV
jgi:ubiquinone/menaquinone biosynthesis C-methylase UbiE